MLGNMLLTVMPKGVQLELSKLVLGADAPQGSGGIAAPFSRIKSAIDVIASNLKYIFPSVAILMFIVAGIAWMTGRKGGEFAKSLIGKVVIGIGVICLAATFVTWFGSIFGGGSSDI